MIDKDAFVLSTISSDESFDSEKLFKAYGLIKQFDELLRKELDLQFRIVNLDGYAIDECQRMIRDEGVSSVMSIVHLQEALIPVVSNECHKYHIVDMLRSKLDDLSPSNEIIIVDNYIFPPRGFRSLEEEQDYLQIFEDIFAPSIGNVNTVSFITKPGYDEKLLIKFKNLLTTLNPKVSITCRTTSDFHDRFWIIDRIKGLFIGTSLNGIGKRYTLFDVICDEDTKEIIRVLEESEMIQKHVGG